MKTRRLIMWVGSTVFFTIVALSIGSAATAASIRTSEANDCAQNECALNATSYRAASDVFGYFFIKGKAPAGFTNIDHLLLGGEGEFGAGAKPPFYGQIRVKGKGNNNYPLLKPTLEGNNLSFRTKAIAGISYKFEGTLTQTDFSDNQPDGDAVVLTGELTKMSKGKAIGHANLEFMWSVGD